MRFSACLRLTRSVGFFWGTFFLGYSAPTAGWRGASGYRLFWRKFVFSLAEGALLGGGRYVSSRPRTRTQSLGHTLLFFAPGHIPLAYPWAWFILRQLKLRTYRGLRYRLGLPARGQRTRTNASTVSRHSDAAVSLIQRSYWRRRLWQARSGSKNVKPKQARGLKNKQKVVKKKGPAMRSKDKKKSVWR